MRPLVGCLLILALGTVTAPSAFAGCEHGARANGVQVVDGLEPSLLGKWQYVAGQSYFVFHPLPVECDGPQCKSAPQPANQMSTVPTSAPKLVSFAKGEFSLTTDRLQSEDVTVGNRFVPGSPTLDGLLRPPQFA